MSNGLGDIVPKDFPRDIHKQVALRVFGEAERKGIKPHLLDHFHDSWLASGYRFCTCVEHDEAFRDSIKRVGVNPNQKEHYIQERELFGFFINGLTVIESLAYSSYILGAMLVENGFPMNAPKLIQVNHTADKYNKYYPNEPLSNELDQLRNSSDYDEWKKIRNILAHRVIPARKITVTLWPPQLDNSPKASWIDDTLELNANTTLSRRKWLARVADVMILAIDTFTKNHLV